MHHPPFCPNPVCACHQQSCSAQLWYLRRGSYSTRTFGTVPRFQCKVCGKGFSAQTFSLDYWVKRRLSYPRILQEITGCSSTRHISRLLSASCDSIQNRVARLCRNALVMQEQAVSELPCAEHFAADGFVSFTGSQYHPHHLNTLVGSGSEFVYFWNEVTVRRTGRMTPAQKLKRAELEREWKPMKDGITHSFIELYGRLTHSVCRRLPESTILSTDEHRSYIRAWRKTAHTVHLGEKGVLTHQQISSKRPRTRDNPLFPVNYIDREIRKDLKNHVRETVCFARNQTHMMQRASLYLWHHNFRKPHRIHDNTQVEEPSHAEVAGLPAARLSSLMWGFFSRRSFLSRSCVTGSHETLWLNRLTTPMKKKRDYCPKHVSRQAGSAHSLGQ